MREVAELSELTEDVLQQERVAVFAEIDGYPTEIRVLSTNDPALNEIVGDYLTPAGFLATPKSTWEVIEKLEAEGYDIVITTDAKNITNRYREWVESDFKVEGLKLKPRKPGEKPGLFEYQRVALQKALSLEPERSRTGPVNFFFFNCGTGTGKTVMGSTGALELFNRDKIDLVLIFTLRRVKADFNKFINEATSLTSKIVDGAKKYRVKEYAKDEAHAYVMNYEKAKFDYDSLAELVKGRRVLFIFDEVQKILNNNQSREAMDKLLDLTSERYIWPMSASIVQGDSERFWKIFEWCSSNPLGSLKGFRNKYVKHILRKEMYVRTRNGKLRIVRFNEYVYDKDKLADVRHRISERTITVRKTDPGVREFFKGLTFVPVEVEMSKEDHKLYSVIETLAKENAKQGSDMQYYEALRYTCLTPLAHTKSNNQISQEIAESDLELTNKHNNKMERMMDDIESIRDEGDKCAVFTHWTNLSLLFLAEELEKRKIPHVLHYGGLSDKQNEEAKRRFREEEDITVFLSSDAGSHGLNLPQARYVLSYDCPYDYDTLMQRNDRIDRADSYLNDLQARVYFYTGTVEERIYGINQERMKVSSAVQGTTEVLGRNQLPEEQMSADELQYLMFGDS